MIFRDRENAGRLLAQRLMSYANANGVLVLGIPRGGVAVAFEIVRELHAPLDVLLSRKLGVPGNEELAFGAVAAGGGIFLDRELIEQSAISQESVDRIVQAARNTLEERAALYRRSRPPLEVKGRTVILADDGVATGASIYAAIRALRQMQPRQLVVAVPVAPHPACDWLKSLADEFISLGCPEDFYAVGQFYAHFSQVSDSQVVDLLDRAEALFQRA